MSSFYKDKPVFGLDIGFNTLKVMQTRLVNKQRVVSGYGVASFDDAAVKDGVIIDHKAVAEATRDLFTKHLIGDITTRRVTVAIPASRAFTRILTLPKLKDADVAEAVRLEAEQYIPMQLDDLYLDHEVTRQTPEKTEVMIVAAPRRTIDSYLQLTRILGLEAVAFETTISASGRLFVQAEQSDVPTVLVDFGSQSTDITVFDKLIAVTGTTPCGGDNFSQLIAERLNVKPEEAHVIKTKYGLDKSKKQTEIKQALSPMLQQILKEIRRVIRYYEERTDTDSKIAQVVTMGGGANMPGLSEFMTDALRLPVRMCDPWQKMSFAGLQPPNDTEKARYITVAGLALTDPKDIFA